MCLESKWDMTYRTSMLFSIFKSRLVKNGLWLLLLQFFNMVAPLLTLPYITRVLSEADFGSFSLALNWVGYLQVIVWDKKSGNVLR